MPRPVSLAVSQPCHESWAQMTPATQGRHCAACDKVVVDFTRKTDAEILALLQHVAMPCGRFRPDQLGRPLLPPPALTPRWRTWLAAAATVLGLREIAAQESRGQQPVSVYSPKLISHDEQKAALLHQRRVAAEPTKTTIVRGRVVDKATGEGLPGVTVLLKGTSQGVVTQADGSFELPIARKNSHKTRVQLLINYVGYDKQKVMVDVPSKSPLHIQLEATPYILGGLAVVAPTPPSWFRAFDLNSAMRGAASRIV